MAQTTHCERTINRHCTEHEPCPTLNMGGWHSNPLDCGFDTAECFPYIMRYQPNGSPWGVTQAKLLTGMGF